MKKEVGRVTEEERDEIQQLFERRNGLTELAKILTADETMVESHEPKIPVGKCRKL